MTKDREIDFKKDHIRTISGPVLIRTISGPNRIIRPNQDHFRTKTGHYQHQIRTISGPSQDQIRTLSRSCHDLFRTLTRPNQDHIKTLSGPYQDHIRTIQIIQYLMLSNRLGHGVKVESPAWGQYCAHLMRLYSSRLVNIMIISTFCSYTIRQKSWTVCSSGP